uniref:Uncharacterized protein n=1 Tax=Meloidogyne hapla TaxID=6305 RepID=A0A1I8BUA7_MELHA
MTGKKPNRGEHIIFVHAEFFENGVKHSIRKPIDFSVNAEDEDLKCLFKVFKRESEEEYKSLEQLKKGLNIYVSLGSEDNIISQEKIEPLFDDKSYNFETDEKGNLKEIEISSTNILKKYLIAREKNSKSNKKFNFGDLQQWVLYNEKYFLMNV